MSGGEGAGIFIFRACGFVLWGWVVVCNVNSGTFLKKKSLIIERVFIACFALLVLLISQRQLSITKCNLYRSL